MTLAALLIAVPQVGAQGRGDLSEVSLDDPVSVSVAFSQLAAPEGSPGVKIGTANSFPDSLAAAQHQPDWPLLLTDRDQLDDRVREDIVRLGATRAVIVGGPAAIESQVEGELASMGLTISRLAGTNRTETAVEIARAGTASQFLLTRDDDPADSLAAGAMAAIDGGYGILLSSTTTLTPATSDFLTARAAQGPIEVVLVGGTAALSAQVEAAVRAITPNVVRIGGATRGLTATALADTIPGPSGAILLDGRHPNNWAAGFAAAAYARTSRQPIVLTEGNVLPDETADWLGRQTFTELLCGPGIATGTCQEATASIGAGSPTGPTNATPRPADDSPDNLAVAFVEGALLGMDTSRVATQTAEDVFIDYGLYGVAEGGSARAQMMEFSPDDPSTACQPVGDVSHRCGVTYQVTGTDNDFANNVVVHVSYPDAFCCDNNGNVVVPDDAQQFVVDVEPPAG